MNYTEEAIRRLKLMTMKPPIFAEDRLVSIEAELMFGTLDPFYRGILERELNTLKVQIQVDLLPAITR